MLLFLPLGLGRDKAPGPDCFPMVFFQIFWNEVEDDIMAFLNEFHSRGKLSKNLGASFSALVPKKPSADIISDFRPISLIGIAYKILAKVLAGRILKVLPSIISPSQDAFVRERQDPRWCSYCK